MRSSILASLALTVVFGLSGCASEPAHPELETVVLPSPGSPLVALRVMVEAGSMDDPVGKEGLAALTALMLGSGGTTERSFKEMGEALYPMAAAIGSWTDREVSVFTGQVHRERLDEFTGLFLEALLKPGFDPADFERNREQLVGYLTSTLRSADDERLGLEILQQRIFAGHPYGHAPAGTVSGLAALTVDDVRDFYTAHYTRARIRLGVAGGYPEGYVEQLADSFTSLPAGDSRPPLKHAEIPAGRHFTLVEKGTGSVGLHFGFPLDINRSDDDFYPLMIANSYLGEHRTQHGRLMQELREARGLNYGDYSYIEHWPNPPGTSTPLAGFPRKQQYFSVWLRPVVPSTAHFALRNALYELERLLDSGLSEADFEATRGYLINYSKLWVQTLASRLGYLMDSAYYGIPPFIDEIESRLARVQRSDVLEAVARHLQSENFQAVIIVADAAGLKQALEAEAPSSMDYANPVSQEVTDTDPAIEAIRVEVDSLTIVPVEQLFE